MAWGDVVLGYACTHRIDASGYDPTQANPQRITVGSNHIQSIQPHSLSIYLVPHGRRGHRAPDVGLVGREPVVGVEAEEHEGAGGVGACV